MQVLQVTVEDGNHFKLVVGQLQVQQGGHIKHSLGDPFVTQLVVVKPHKCQLREVFEVISEQDNQRGHDCKISHQIDSITY